MATTQDQLTPTAPPATGYLRWPPPGLERVHAQAWRLTGVVALGSALAVLPLLLTIALRESFWSLGTFGAAWWVPVAISLCGLLVVFGAAGQLVGLLLDCARALRQGHGRRTVAYVAVDSARDTGFLLQGARYFAHMPPRERGWLLRARVTAVGAYLFAAAWLPLGFVLTVLRTARSSTVSTTAFWYFALTPALIALLLGLSARIFENATVARARKRWHQSGAEGDVINAEIEAWNADFDARLAPVGIHRGQGSNGIGLRWLAGGIVVVGALLLLPIGTIGFTTAVGPVLTQMAIPRFGSTMEKFAKLEPLRTFGLPKAPGIKPLEAGDALAALATVGQPPSREPLAIAPVRSYEQPWTDAGARIALDPSHSWITGPFSRTLNPAERAYLAKIAAHPAHAEFATLARAEAADIAGARWRTPLPSSAALAALPLPRFGVLREGAYAHIGLAAYQLANGDAAAAETTVREVISAGLLLADDGPTLIDGLIGASIAEAGANALQHLYQGTGRNAEAERLRSTLATADRMFDAVTLWNPGSISQPELQGTARMVTDTALARGLRWELFSMLNFVGPCMNPHNAVFGPDDEYRDWLQRARKALIRYPNDRSRFDTAVRGGMVAAPTRSPGFTARLVNLTLGRRGTAGSCAEVLTSIMQ